MKQEIIRFKSSVGVFGKILGEQDLPASNLVDVKKLLIPVIGFARLYALRALVTETNTLQRSGWILKERSKLIKNNYSTTNRVVADSTSPGLAIHLTSTTYSPG